MGITITTGLVRKSNNTSTSIDLRAYTSVDSARIRWVGKNTTVNGSKSSSGSDAGISPLGVGAEVPAMPLGNIFSSVGMSMTISNLFADEIVDAVPRIYTTSGASYIGSSRNIAGNGSTSFSQISYNSAESNSLVGAEIISPSGAGVVVSLSVTLNYYSILVTQNPSTMCGGQSTTYNNTIQDGQSSGWVTLNGLVAGQINTITHSIQGSGLADIEIEYVVSMKPTIASQDATGVSYTVAVINGIVTNLGGSAVTCGFEFGTTNAYGTNISKGSPTVNVPFSHNLTGLIYGQTYYYRAYATNSDGTSYGSPMTFATPYPYLPAPQLLSPSNSSKVKDRLQRMSFTLTENSYNNATKYHAKLTFGEYINQQDMLVYESVNSQAGWYYKSGVDWLVFPSVGVNPGAEVSFVPLENLDFKTYYWTACSYDGTVYGEFASSRSMRVVLSTKGLYALFINAVEYLAYSIVVKETSNGQIGQIEVELTNVGGVNNGIINYNDVLQLVISDVLDNEEEYKGLIREKTPQGNSLKITAVTGSGILSERLIGQDYTNQDIGLTIKDIIDTYCQPLTSNNVITSTSISIPITSKDKTPLAVFEDIRKQCGIMYYIDKDWDMHLYTADSISQSYITINKGVVV